jgi:hypothetical protein
MNFSSLIDWSFFWKVFQNFLYSAMPFVLIPVAVICIGMLLGVIIAAVKKAQKSG